MADEFSTPSAAAMATASPQLAANASKDKQAPAVRPERPDEEQYKAELAKADKELKSAEERLVRIFGTRNDVVAIGHGNLIYYIGSDSFDRKLSKRKSIQPGRTTRTPQQPNASKNSETNSQPSDNSNKPTNPAAPKFKKRSNV